MVQMEKSFRYIPEASIEMPAGTRGKACLKTTDTMRSQRLISQSPNQVSHTAGERPAAQGRGGNRRDFLFRALLYSTLFYFVLLLSTALGFRVPGADLFQYIFRGSGWPHIDRIQDDHRSALVVPEARSGKRTGAVSLRAEYSEPLRAAGLRNTTATYTFK